MKEGNDYYKKFFKRKCPYTGERCRDWNCDECDIQAEEIQWMKDLNEDEQHFLRKAGGK